MCFHGKKFLIGKIMAASISNTPEDLQILALEGSVGALTAEFERLGWVLEE